MSGSSDDVEMAFQRLVSASSHEVLAACPGASVITSAKSRITQLWPDGSVVRPVTAAEQPGTQVSGAPRAPARRVGRRDQRLVPRPAAIGDGSSSTPANPNHWTAKPLSSLRATDFTAMREDYGITVRAVNAATAALRAAMGLDEDEEENVTSSTAEVAADAEDAARLTVSGCPGPLRCWEEGNARADIPAAVITHLRGTKKLMLPTPVQMQAITVAAAGNDVLAVAETGSGKTLSYLIPMLLRVARCAAERPLADSEARSKGPFGLVLVPSKELVMQVVGVAEELLPHFGIVCPGNTAGVVAITPEKSKDEQYNLLTKGAHILVGTPGRLQDLLAAHYLALTNTTIVAVDEADTMVDDGMVDAVATVLQAVHGAKAAPNANKTAVGPFASVQSLFFSATMPPEAEALSRKCLRPAHYSISVPPRFASITQSFVVVPVGSADDGDGSVVASGTGLSAAAMRIICALLSINREDAASSTGGENGTQTATATAASANAQSSLLPIRPNSLPNVRGLEFLGNGVSNSFDASQKSHKAVIFANTRKNCDAIVEQLGRASAYDAPGSPLGLAISAHAGMTQEDRRKAVEQLQRGEKRVLVTTDLLARGLHVDNMMLVINAEAPVEKTPAHMCVRYVHRVGRTGRAGASGAAVTLLRLPAAALVRAEAVDEFQSRSAQVDDGPGDGKNGAGGGGGYASFRKEMRELQTLEEGASSGSDDDGHDGEEGNSWDDAKKKPRSADDTKFAAAVLELMREAAGGRPVRPGDRAGRVRFPKVMSAVNAAAKGPSLRY